MTVGADPMSGDARHTLMAPSSSVDRLRLGSIDERSTSGFVSNSTTDRMHDGRGTWREHLDGHSVVVTEVFWSYWYLAAERQAIFYRRLSGEPHPWTDDKILARHRFTNAYRASDRVSQFLLQRVIYDRDRDILDTILRVLMFKIFNRIETWDIWYPT